MFRRTSPTRSSAPRPVETRHHFHQELEDLEARMREMGEAVRRALERSVEALAASDVTLAESVIAADDDIDRRCREIDERAIDLMGRQQPMASDLRLLVALVHVGLHLERIGDAAVDLAELTRSVASLEPVPEVLQGLEAMGHAAASMTALAVDAFASRDRDLCEELPKLDDRVDDLDREMAGHVLANRDDVARLEWALRMLPASRALERAADHAVDIAEQALFLMTGELQELD